MNSLFRIFKVNDKDASKIEAEPDDPHAHNYEELIIGVEGSMEHFIDFEKVVTDAPFVSFVSKGKVHRLIPRTKDGQCDIKVVRFKSELIPEIAFRLYAFYHNRANLSLQKGPRFKSMLGLFEIMSLEAEQESPNYSIIQQCLSLLFTIAEAERVRLNENLSENLSTQNTIFGDFLHLLEKNYHKTHSVHFYADELNMSVRNLNLICRDVLNSNISEIIETRKLIESKSLLISTEKTVAEIAFELGYKENAYFSNVFKKKEGLSPTAFRKEMKRMLSS